MLRYPPLCAGNDDSVLRWIELDSTTDVPGVCIPCPGEEGVEGSLLFRATRGMLKTDSCLGITRELVDGNTRDVCFGWKCTDVNEEE